MSQILLSELDQAKKRLNYYVALKQKAPTRLVTKWIDIYAERARKLEHMVTKLNSQRMNVNVSVQASKKH